MDMYTYCQDPETHVSYWETILSGYSIIQTPLLNKSTAFTEEEQDRLGLRGLLPHHCSDIEQQLQRTYESFRKKNTPLEKYIYLMSLQDRNETLFYALLNKHIIEMMPIVYTPVVGEACRYYSQIYRRPRGLFISYPNKDIIPQILDNCRSSQVRVIVVSDGERILGLGDLGTGGMGIPIGKLSLYSLCAGIHPVYTLPILLDTGTDNSELLTDPLYLGWKHTRIRGKEYDDFVVAFVSAVKAKFPHVLLQWEDFAKDNAEKLLDKYQGEICSFNDDIQGTGAVTLSGLMAACKAKGSRLRDEKIIMTGGGSAAKGIVEQALIVMEQEGLTFEEGKKNFYLIDSKGLVYEGRGKMDEPFKIRFARAKEEVASWDLKKDRISLEDVVYKVRPTVLIGASAQPGIFHETMVRQMARYVERPIIFPLSNPTSKSEAKAEDLIRWTYGKALVATGSPFDPVSYEGEFITIGQCNNAFIFPGMGLGILASEANHVSHSMFATAAQTLSEMSPAVRGTGNSLFPNLLSVRQIAQKVALAVAKEAQKLGFAKPSTPEEMEKKVKGLMWEPRYAPIRKKK